MCKSCIRIVAKAFQCLNPCSNGICVKVLPPRSAMSTMRLNPCSNGICVKGGIHNNVRTAKYVLILVLMEYV